MNFPPELKYIVSTSKLKIEINRNSTTAVVFIHGILSNSKNAFKLQDYSHLYFWDIINQIQIFKSFDMCLFNYGRFNLTNVFQLRSPINSLTKIAYELRDNLKNYSNVIFIGHSQGGLLGKTFATLFSDEYSIYLFTLHTPHENISLSVMKYEYDKEWNEKVSFQIPHTFCASINDTRFAAPKNALHSFTDDFYLSYDSSKLNLGHGHLSSAPDKQLIDKIAANSFYFINSDLENTIFPFNYYSNKDFLEENGKYICFSSSISRIKEYLNISNKEIFDPSLFSDDPDGIKVFDELISSNENIYLNSCSANFFNKYSLRKDYSNAIGVVDLDAVFEETFDEINLKLCEDSFEYSKSNDNPYSEIIFDPIDFKFLKCKKLIYNFEFRKIFIDVCKENRYKLSEFVKDKTKFHNGLNRSIKILKDKIFRDIYNKAFFIDGVSDVYYDEFEYCIMKLIGELRDHSISKFRFEVVYEYSRKIFFLKKIYLNLRSLQIVISKIMRSDGQLYWLDRDIKIIHKFLN